LAEGIFYRSQKWSWAGEECANNMYKPLYVWKELLSRIKHILILKIFWNFHEHNKLHKLELIYMILKGSLAWLALGEGELKQIKSNNIKAFLSDARYKYNFLLIIYWGITWRLNDILNTRML
jgi:hypothetical protein